MPICIVLGYEIVTDFFSLTFSPASARHGLAHRRRARPSASADVDGFRYDWGRIDTALIERAQGLMRNADEACRQQGICSNP